MPGWCARVLDASLLCWGFLCSGDYIKVGCNEQFSVRPAIVHFGGYDVKSVHRTTVRVTNTTSHSKRIVILPPNTPFFKVRPPPP